MEPWGEKVLSPSSRHRRDVGWDKHYVFGILSDMLLTPIMGVVSKIENRRYRKSHQDYPLTTLTSAPSQCHYTRRRSRQKILPNVSGHDSLATKELLDE